MERTDFALEVEGLEKSFDAHAVLKGVDLRVPRGSVFTVLGPSGTGKSVLLKCIANILPADAGRIVFDGRPLREHSAREDFRKRCSFLFQGNALFDSLTALENVALPLEQTTSLGKKEIRERSLEALRQLEMEDFADRYPRGRSLHNPNSCFSTNPPPGWTRCAGMPFFR